MHLWNAVQCGAFSSRIFFQVPPNQPMAPEAPDFEIFKYEVLFPPFFEERPNDLCKTHLYVHCTVSEFTYTDIVSDWEIHEMSITCIWLWIIIWLCKEAAVGIMHFLSCTFQALKPCVCKRTLHCIYDKLSEICDGKSPVLIWPLGFFLQGKWNFYNFLLEYFYTRIEAPFVTLLFTRLKVSHSIFQFFLSPPSC